MFSNYSREENISCAYCLPYSWVSLVDKHFNLIEGWKFTLIDLENL